MRVALRGADVLAAFLAGHAAGRRGVAAAPALTAAYDCGHAPLLRTPPRPRADDVLVEPAGRC